MSDVTDGSTLVTRPRHRRLVLLSAVVTAGLAFGAAACGSDDGSTGAGGGVIDGGTTDAAERGRQTMISNGCASCHGTNGQGGVGPTYIGLAGSRVELEDGTMVVADDDYLRRSIVDPSAEIRPGYSVNMPEQQFDPGEVDDMIAYIKSLA